MGFADEGGHATQRFFIGIGVGSYDDPTLDLPRAEPDVVDVAEWFTKRSGITHQRELAELGESPRAAQITESLADFLDMRSASDVVVIYMACHGELEGARTHLFGRNTRRERLAGRSIDAATLGAILGQSAPHNVLLIIDACVAGRLGGDVLEAARKASDELNNRDPRRPQALLVVASTFGRDSADDGRFAEAFLEVVESEKWTGTTSHWISSDQLIEGLNEVLEDLGPTQVAEVLLASTRRPQLIPNPNVASRQLGQLIADVEFAAHFDPAARGVARGESGTFFTGRVRELRRIVDWLGEGHPDAAQAADAAAPPPLLVITGSPGSGKSALLSRIAVLSDPVHRPDQAELAALPEGTVPSESALTAVAWCHNKTERQIVEEIATALGGRATTAEALLQLAAGRSATIAVDALDEIAEGLARQVASRVLKPLAAVTGIQLLIATRRRPVRDGAGGEADLLDHLGAEPASVIDLDQSPETKRDMRDYVEARILAATGEELDAADAAVADLAEQIADAAGNSFLVAAIAARSAAAGKLTRQDGTYVLPTEVGEALAGYIDALPEPEKARGLLRPLAWSEGAGLPWGTLWPRLATALSRVTEAVDTTYHDDDVRALLDSAGDLVVESVAAGQPVYRLFHEALAEHLREDTEEAVAHEAFAEAMLELVGDRPWRQVQRYVTTNLPVHLLGAGLMDELVDVLTDPTWDRSRREQSGDPLAAIGMADLAIEHLLADAPDDLRVVPLCVAHSRAMTTAAPLILDVLALSGQLARAEMMANNLAYAPDRMLAYRQLCGVYARERDVGAARRCLEEVRRALPAMPQTHQPMAWFWVTQAALDARLPERAHAAAEAAVEAAFAIAGDGWDLPNGYFWAARACALISWKQGTQRIRDGLDALDPSIALRNQSLQAASASGHRVFLEQRLAEYLGGARYPRTMIRDGNLALALADANMKEEAAQVFDLVGDGPPQGNPDSNKRWAWALALSGRMAQAVESLAHVHDPIEKGKAIARIASVAAREPEETATLDALVPLAKELLNGYEPKAQARLIRVLWLAGAQEDALAHAELEIATSHATRAMADPRDRSGPEQRPGEGPGVPQDKVARREMVSSVVPVPDLSASLSAQSEASRGNLEKAREHLAKIAVPLFRAQALAAIAKHDPDSDGAVRSWLRAMAEARRASRGMVDEILPLGVEVLNRAGRTEDANALGVQIEALDARWELESFSEQYEALRRTMPPGPDRTRRMTALLLVPQRLAHTLPWTRDYIRLAWASDEDGKRLFALGLIQGEPGLVVAEVLVDGIRASRSAFEQYHALLAAAGSNLEGEDAKAVRAATEAELRGDPRADGIDSNIHAAADRMAVARRLLERLPGG